MHATDFPSSDDHVVFVESSTAVRHASLLLPTQAVDPPPRRNSVAAIPQTSSNHGSSFKAKLQQHLPRLSDMRAASLVSSLVKVDPNVRHVAQDVSQVDSFQALLHTFDEPREDEAVDADVRSVFGTLNSMLQPILQRMVSAEKLTNGKIARDVSAEAVALFGHGLQQVVRLVESPVVSTLLADVSHRLLQVDQFVRAYFVVESLELEQIVASLQDSLKEEEALVRRLQGELKAAEASHKRKVAEMTLRNVIQMAKLAKHEKGADSSVSYTYSDVDEDVYATNARLTKELTELKADAGTMRTQLESATRQISVLHGEVEALGEPLYRDRQIQTLQDELYCERKRVKALEMEVQELRLRQAEAAKVKVRAKESMVHKLRHVTQPTMQDTIETDDSDASSSSDKDDAPPTAALDQHRQVFLAMLNYTLRGEAHTLAKASFTTAAGVAQAVVKLKSMLPFKSRKLATVPLELVHLRNQMLAIYDRKRMHDEYTALVQSPRAPFHELTLGWFVSKYSTLVDAEKETRAFLNEIDRFRPLCGHVRLMGEFLEGRHSDEALEFYLWVTKALPLLDIGAPFPTATDLHPQYICKLKASLVTRTIFRLLKFQTCGVSKRDRALALDRLDALDVLVECHRLFAAATAKGPIYMGEFNALLDKFAECEPLGECYPLDVYLYLLVLMFEKQREWRMDRAVRVFHGVAYDVWKEDQKRRADAAMAGTIASTKKAQKAKEALGNKTKKKRKRKKAEKIPSHLSKEAFGLFLSKIDLNLAHGDLHDLTVKVLCTRPQYTVGITPETFVFTAHKHGWFRYDFATMPTLVDELHVTPDDCAAARKHLASAWELHAARLSVACERDKNPFVSRHILQCRTRLVAALRAPQPTDKVVEPVNPVRTLALFRAMLQLMWKLAGLRSFRTRYDDDDPDAPATPAPIVEITRSVELILVAKGIAAIPEVTPGPQVFDLPKDRAADDDLLSTVDGAAIRDLFPPQSALQTTECIELNRILHRYSWHLTEVFRAYSLICNPTFGLSFDGFQELTADLGILSPKLPLVAANTVFAAVAARRQCEKLDAAAFLELLIRLAVERQTRETGLPQSTRVALVFDHLCTNFVIPNICQSSSLNFRQQVAALEVQRLLHRHRNFLRRVFLHYARQDQSDDERSKMNLTEFETFVAEFCLNDHARFPASMNPLVFNSVQDDVDESQCVYQEFTTAIVAIAQIKQNNPFVKWRHTTATFINELIDFAATRHAKFRSILT
ncbi:Aste57867_10906 [Aphanomyces stellatus]|uniref:Aste57867_10906 protein n=1 Tax=Aphanomyces stellatus TaxID=120398 RepID=A0A485KS04_9STRA|nr:hypothetical protein As57867_010866 [Aphanomyces stellatus]VFT87774.1 Aste57867_10906 [Aphanomyces stellatus]